MSSPAPAFLPWAIIPSYAPVATAIPMPVSTVVPFANAGPVEYPSIYLPGYAVTLTCPSWICNPIGATSDNTTSSLAGSSARIFTDALTSINEVIFGKQPAPADHAPIDIAIVKPTPTLAPGTLTVSALDAYPSLSSWFPDPILKWGTIFPIAQICYKIWWSLDFSSVFDLIWTYFSGIHTIAPYIWHEVFPYIRHDVFPYIWHEGFPFVFGLLTLFACIVWVVLMSCLLACAEMGTRASMMVKIVGLLVFELMACCTEFIVPPILALKKNVGTWVFDHLARCIEYIITSLVALTFRDYVQIATTIGLICTWIYLQKREALLGRTINCLKHQLVDLRFACALHKRLATAAHAALDARVWNNSHDILMLQRDGNHSRDYFNALQDNVAEHFEALYGRTNAHAQITSALQQHVVEHFEALYGRSNAHTQIISALQQFAHDANNVFLTYIIKLEQIIANINSHLDDLREICEALNERVNVIDERLDLHRKDILTLQRHMETRLKATEERFDDVETVVEGHDADIRVVHSRSNTFKDHVKKKYKELREHFHVVETLFEAMDADIRVIRGNVTEQDGQAQQRISSVEVLVDDVEKLLGQQLGAVEESVHKMKQTVYQVLKKISNAEKKATDAKHTVSVLEESFETYNKWCIKANDEFTTLSGDIANVKIAMSAVRSTSTLHKDYLIYVFDKLLPQFSQDVTHSYAHIDAQPGAPVQIEVILNERLQTALLRMISDKLISTVSQPGASEEEQQDGHLMPAPLIVKKNVPADDSDEAAPAEASSAATSANS